ncbi:MAG TPA: FeoA family protein [Candidatus Methanomethylophilaceae archaeon]|nr:FeoA family protein [Candidatus Methanomethylophilaceae archaeon]
MRKKCNSCCGSCRGCNRTTEQEERSPKVGGIPLATLGKGGCGKIVRISGKSEQRRHLSDLGFAVGTEISVVNKTSGNYLVEVRKSRIAMDGSMASKIHIIPEVF